MSPFLPLFKPCCVSMWGYVYVSIDVHWGQKRKLDPQVLRLHAVVSCLVWVLDIKPEPSVRSVIGTCS